MKKTSGMICALSCAVLFCGASAIPAGAAGLTRSGSRAASGTRSSGSSESAQTLAAAVNTIDTSVSINTNEKAQELVTDIQDQQLDRGAVDTGDIMSRAGKGDLASDIADHKGRTGEALGTDGRFGSVSGRGSDIIENNGMLNSRDINSADLNGKLGQCASGDVIEVNQDFTWLTTESGVGVSVNFNSGSVYIAINVGSTQVTIDKGDIKIGKSTNFKTFKDNNSGDILVFFEGNTACLVHYIDGKGLCIMENGKAEISWDNKNGRVVVVGENGRTAIITNNEDNDTDDSENDISSSDNGNTPEGNGGSSDSDDENNTDDNSGSNDDNNNGSDDNNDSDDDSSDSDDKNSSNDSDNDNSDDDNNDDTDTGMVNPDTDPGMDGGCHKGMPSDEELEAALITVFGQVTNNGSESQNKRQPSEEETAAALATLGGQLTNNGGKVERPRPSDEQLAQELANVVDPAMDPMK